MRLSTSPSVAIVLSLAIFLQGSVAQDYPNCPEPDSVCDSWGVDFQSDGTYFQNTNSPDPFTFVEQFTGCQDDFALNFLVDPAGTQYACSNVTMTPDNTNMMSTCQVNKNQLSSGQYSILILSNNGQCAPIANQRDFTISTGPAQTSTITPTVDFTTTSTPISTVYTTETVTSIITAAPPYTITKPSSLYTPTTTTTPPPVTRTKVVRLLTLTIVEYELKVVPKWVTQTATCNKKLMATKASKPDPIAKIVPTIVPDLLKSTVGDALDLLTDTLDIGGGLLKGGLLGGILARRAQDELPSRPARGRRLQKRAPDETVTTVMETDTAKFVTSTSVVTASPVTSTQQVDKTVTSTETPPPATVYHGVSTAAPKTVTAAPRTVTKTKYTVEIVYNTKTTTTSPTFTTTVQPTGCK